MDVEELKKDVREGRVDADRLVELIVSLQRQLHAANQRIEELEKKLGGKPTQKLDEPFSVESEERRQEERKKKRRKRKKRSRRGRVTTAEKVAQAVVTLHLRESRAKPSRTHIKGRRVLLVTVPSLSVRR